MSVILIIDDDAALREGLAEALVDLGHEVLEAGNGEAGLALQATRAADAVLLDLRMPGLDGMEVLRRLRAHPAPPPVAILTAVPTASNTIEAMRLGAVDHIAKPIGRDDLAALLGRMLPERSAQARPMPVTDGAETLVGNSAAMRAVQKAIGMLADSESTVLITGETGTGKEVVARALHQHGRRAGKPFIAVNCAAIPADLLESQLFGHVRGAFTGAVTDRAGSFREAEGGTLFLDEIGDMAPALQAKLLRVLQERVVTPVGGKAVPIDVRILAATHQDLPARVREGKFREDLYWRLGVVPVHLPPLRERLGDIVPLAEHFLALVAGNGTARGAAANGPRRLSADAASRLLSHGWPGNVRELRNAMERAAALARREVLGAEDLEFLRETPAETEHGVDWLSGDLPGAVARLETAMIRRALEAAGGNRADAARRLNIHRQLLYEKLRRYGLDASANRTDAVGNADGAEPE
jgi:DNA-binding NtrC family response regulator